MNNVLAWVGAAILGIVSGVGFISFVGATPITFGLGIVGGMVIGMLSYVAILQFTGQLDKMAEDQVRFEAQRKLTHEEFTGLEGLSGINAEDFMATIRGARETLRAIYDASKRLTDTNRGYKVQLVVEQGHAIVDEIKKDPKDYRIARSWFNTHLTQFKDIVEKYATVGNVGGPRGEVMGQDFDTTIEQLKINFGKLREDIQANDLNALRIDMEVLNDQLKVENRS